jgi:hypothetical protein
MTLATGMRLRSQVCATEVIVIKAAPVTLTCGGHPMIPLSQTPAEGLSLVSELSGGVQLGKRYTDVAGSVEVLVTKPGSGTLADGTVPLVVKEAKPLPSSD